jgi:hypothetical protein
MCSSSLAKEAACHSVPRGSRKPSLQSVYGYGGNGTTFWFIFYLNFLIPIGDYEWHCAQESLLSAPRELISHFVQRATEKLREKK